MSVTPAARASTLLVCVACGAPPSPPREPQPQPIAPERAPLAAPSLDTRFGGNGRVVFDVGPHEHQLHAVVALPDGSALAAGHASFDVRDACVAKLTRDGALDPAFGKGGVARVGTFEAFLAAIAIDPAGRIVVAGYFYPKQGGAQDALVARLLPDGTLDGSFGSGGVYTVDLGGSDDRAAAVLVLPSGELAIVGNRGLGDEYKAFVLHLDDAGRPVRRFAAEGFAFVDLLPGREFVTRARLDRDGSIVVGGYAVGESGGIVARILPDGTLDEAAGVSVVPELRDGTAWSLAIDDQHRILLGGHDGQRGMVVRFTRDGRRDPAWGRAGIAMTDGKDNLMELVALPDGGAIAAGWRERGDHPTWLLGRFDETGASRWSHGDGANNDYLLAAARANDGRVIGAGMTSSHAGIRGIVLDFRIGTRSAGSPTTR